MYLQHTDANAPSQLEDRNVVDCIPLDQLSTRHTFTPNLLLEYGVSHGTIRETQAAIEQAEDAAQDARCENKAPYIFFIDNTGKPRIVQGCCNDWTCKRCGVIRAKKEYGRMVHGARELADAGHKLYFLTLTCRGREMSKKEAEAGYYGWTNATLNAMRNRAKRKGAEWFYSGVTERQKRGHPHSHYQITWMPEDATPYAKGKRLPNGAIAKHDCFYSEWLTQACVRAGLGKMTDITEVRSPVAVAVYQAKYMFKDAMRTVWPKGWRRVRYSNNWPKLPVQKPVIAFPLLRYDDWKRMEAYGVTVYADSPETLEAAYAREIMCVKYVKPAGA